MVRFGESLLRMPRMPSSGMARVQLKGMRKEFEGTAAVEKLDLEVKDKEFVVLLGPSGCGKTTTLRCIAGLEDADEGEIYIGDRLVNDLDPKERNIAMVFQSYALYPHMTVYQNMAFPLENAKVAEREIIDRVNKTARLLQIEALLGRKPAQLSGGQRQRVALGRAIVREPTVFLMDEPLSNLDAQLRVHMRAELKKLQKDIGVTTIYVTHDQVEAMTMADRVALLNKGVLQQYDSPRKLYDRPANRFAASFIGSPPINLVPCDVQDGRDLDAGDFRLPVPDHLAAPLRDASASKVVLGIRPQDVGVSSGAAPDASGTVVYRFPPSSVPAEIYTTEPLGDSTILDLKVGDKLLKAVVSATFEGDAGTKVVIRFPPERLHLFDGASGRAIG
jgi:multiple sugar transport system ATP-binding protein